MRKLNISVKMAQQLKENLIRILADNTTETLELPVNIEPPPLGCGEEEEEDISEVVPPKRYNLRKRS